MRETDARVKEALTKRVLNLEKHLDADVIFFYGPIYPTIEKRFRDFLENLKQNGVPRTRLAVF